MAGELEEKRDVATAGKKSALKKLRALKRLRMLLRKASVIEDPIVKEAAEFKKRLETGEEKFLSPEESAKWRESIRQQQEVITRQLEARLKR